MPEKHRNAYEGFLKARGVSLHAFPKDLAGIKSRLRRRAYHTAKGVSVTVPEEEVGLVEVEKQKIVVHDELLSVGPK